MDDEMTASKTAPAATDPWADVLDSAVVADKRDARPTVDITEVPAGIVRMATMLAETGKVATLPVAGEALFNEGRVYFQTAATFAGKSATVSAVWERPKGTDTDKADKGNIVGLKVSVGERRGAKPKSGDAAPTPAE